MKSKSYENRREYNLICTNCKKSFIHKQSHTKFCSYECKREWINGEYVKKPTLQKKCLSCNSIFTPGSNNQKCCCQKCALYLTLYRENNKCVDCGKLIANKSKKCRSCSKMGHSVSEKTIMKVRNVHLGKPLSEEHKKKIREGNLGKIVSEESKLKMSNFAKIRFANGLSEETKEKISKSKLLSYSLHPEIIENMRIKRRKYLDSHPEEKERFKLRRAKQIMPFKDSSIEVKIQNFLAKLHIEYLAHKYISEITHSYQCDIFIPVQDGINQKTIIECDGCFFHNCPICKLPLGNGELSKKVLKQTERDELRTKELQEKGFKVMCLWEHEIKPIGINQFKNKLGNLK